MLPVMSKFPPSGRDLDGFVRACLAGGDPACEALFHYLNSMISPVLSGLRLRADDRDEVRSRTWSRLHPAFRAGRPDDRSNRAIVAYARVIARNEALTYLDGRNRQAFVQLPAEPSEKDFRDLLDPAPDPERQLMIKEALTLLGQSDPVDVFILFMKFMGCSTAQIRHDLALPPYEKRMSANAIDLRYHRMMKRLNGHRDG